MHMSTEITGPVRPAKIMQVYVQAYVASSLLVDIIKTLSCVNSDQSSKTISMIVNTNGVHRLLSTA